LVGWLDPTYNIAEELIGKRACDKKIVVKSTTEFDGSVYKHNITQKPLEHDAIDPVPRNCQTSKKRIPNY